MTAWREWNGGLDTKLRRVTLLALAVAALLTGCESRPRPGAAEPRRGDEIVAAGKFFHTGTPVVLWLDPGGYDAYRVERRFSPLDESNWETSKAQVKELTTPNRYGLRQAGLPPEQIERVRGGGWDLPVLQSVVDQFVIHYDAAGTSRQCFNMLQDHADLSVHFLIDLDGTIYQTLDLKERAWHATTSNSRSVGVELANLGAYGPTEPSPLAQWYQRETNGQTRIMLPATLGDGGIRTRDFTGHPARPEPVTGMIQGSNLTQYDFTPQQYDALIKLTATLCNIFPRLQCDYPKDTAGNLIPGKLSDSKLADFHGVIGHYHIQTNKVDPGPAFQWERVIGGARELLKQNATPASSSKMGRERTKF